MYGTWKSVEPRPFPGDGNVPCQVYSWTGPAALNRLEIIFYSPQEERPRRFFSGTTLDYWRNPDAGSKDLDLLCSAGIPLLSAFEKAAHEHPEVVPRWEGSQNRAPLPISLYYFYRALFRNRLNGRVTMRRRLRYYKDFVDLRERNTEHKLIIPQCVLQGEDFGSRLTGRELLSALQTSYFREARSTIRDEVSDVRWIDQVSGRRVVDRLLVEGKPSGLTAQQVWGAVSRSLIADMDLEAELDLVARYDDEFRHFVQRLDASLRRRTSAQFDAWLDIESRKKFLRLIARTHTLQGDDREAAKKRAQSFYRVLLWDSYQTMARAYGVVALAVFVDFCSDSLLQPDVTEISLFSQMHRPQFYLASLPLAFFTPAQLCWIAHPLLELWGQEKFDPANYTALTSILDLYGTCASERRRVDRELKAYVRRRDRQREQTHCTRGAQLREGDPTVESRGDEAGSGRRTAVYLDPDTHLDDWEAFPEIHPPRPTCPACPTCPRILRTVKSYGQNDSWLLLEVICEDCDDDPWFARLDLRNPLVFPEIDARRPRCPTCPRKLECLKRLGQSTHWTIVEVICHECDNKAPWFARMDLQRYLPGCS